MFTILLILGVEKIFGKQGAVEKGDINFYIGGLGTFRLCIGG